MIRIFAATQVKNTLGEILKHVYAHRDHIIVEKSGIPVAVIIPISLYHSIYVRQGDADPNLAEQLDIAAETIVSPQGLRTESGRLEGKEGGETQ